MKPDTHSAAKQLVDHIRHSIPFDLPESRLCEGICIGCPKKLLNYLEVEVEDFECRLKNKDIRLGDLSQLAGKARKIHRVLKLNQLTE